MQTCSARSTTCNHYHVTTKSAKSPTPRDLKSRTTQLCVPTRDSRKKNGHNNFNYIALYSKTWNPSYIYFMLTYEISFSEVIAVGVYLV
jgi:hypothetical protein